MFRLARVRSGFTFRTVSCSRSSRWARPSSNSIGPCSLQTTSSLPPRRWQSTDTDQKAADRAPPSSDSNEARTEDAGEPSDPAKQELESKSREIIELKDKYLRSVADFRNLQERTKRDVESARQFAIQRFAGDLIESIDNLDRALEAVPSESLVPITESNETASDQTTPSTHSLSKDLINLHAGLKMTESILMGTLKKHGLERFDPVEEGRKFDPKLDEATFMTQVEGKEDGDAIHTQSKGFVLNGRVLRAAKVGVVKNA